MVTCDGICRCNISPFVLIDGTYNPDCQRLLKLIQQMEETTRRTLKCTNSGNAETEGCKALIRGIFIDVSCLYFVI